MKIFEGLQSVSNIHPLFVHFPIGLLLVATLLFVLSALIKNNTELRVAAKWNLIIGSLFAIITAVTGLLASGTLPHNEEIHQAMLIHRNIMMLTTILALILASYIFLRNDLNQIKNYPLFLTCLVLMSLLLVVGADYGGKMVFKYGAGTELFRKLYPDAGKNHEHREDHSHDRNKNDKGGVKRGTPHGHGEHDHEAHP